MLSSEPGAHSETPLPLESTLDGQCAHQRLGMVWSKGRLCCGLRLRTSSRLPETQSIRTTSLGKGGSSHFTGEKTNHQKEFRGPMVTALEIRNQRPQFVAHTFPGALLLW